MISKYKYIFLLSLLCFGAGAWAYFYFALHQPFVLAKNSETPKFISEVVNALNKTSQIKDKKYQVYSAGFDVFDKIPKSANPSQNNILWLGDKALGDLSNIDDYGLILTASFFGANYLDSKGVKAYFVPIGYYQKKPIKKGDEWVVIGHPPFVSEALQHKGISFKAYNWDEVIKNPSLLYNVKAVAAEDPYITTGSFEVPPVLLDLAASDIPILAQWKGENLPNLLYQFNDNINFYMYENNASDMIDEINKESDDIKERLELNKGFIERYFSVKTAGEDIKNIILYGKPKPQDYPKNSLVISLRTKVGHYGGGEYWLAKDIKDYMKKEAYTGHIVFENSFYDESAEVHLKLRGPVYDKDLKTSKGISFLWQIYPEGNNLTKKDYLQDMTVAAKGSDAIALASKEIALMMQKKGYNAYYLPQFTNTDRFYRDVDEKLLSEVLFVGNYHFRREGVVWAVKKGLPITIYGDKYPKGLAKEKYVDNRILRKYYSSAKIVLNDTKPLMRELGFISNRIFDATACGALVISDYMKEIEEIYGDSIPMYHTPEELAKLVQYYLEHPKEREKLSKKAQEITLQNFGHHKILKELYQIIEKTKQEKL